MKISKSKQELARIISENGGWREGAEWAAQDGVGSDGLYNVAAYGERPVYVKDHAWHKPSNFSAYHEDWFKVSSPVNGWHQTILSRDEYFHLYQVPDAGGWIEWNGGECPVERGAPIDVKFRDGTMQPACDERGEKSPSHRYWTNVWSHSNHDADIIAYRTHKPEQAKPEFCESVTRSIHEPTVTPTLDQLLQDWRNADDYAQRKQTEADEAAAMRDERWQAVHARAGEMGVTIRENIK